MRQQITRRSNARSLAKGGHVLPFLFLGGVIILICEGMAILKNNRSVELIEDRRFWAADKEGE